MGASLKKPMKTLYGAQLASSILNIQSIDLSGTACYNINTKHNDFLLLEVLISLKNKLKKIVPSANVFSII